jgi:hypothetical protein
VEVEGFTRSLAASARARGSSTPPRLVARDGASG